MYESDDAFRARQEANWAHQDLRVAESDLRNAQSNLLWAENDLRNAQNRGGGGGYGGSPGGGGGLGILVFWPFVYWRYTLFAVVFAAPSLYFSMRGTSNFFRGSHSSFSLSAYLFAGYAISVLLGWLFARWAHLPWFRAAVILSALVPLLVLRQLTFFSESTASHAKAKLKSAPALKAGTRSNAFITPAFVAATYTPQYIVFQSPLETLQAAWQQELTKPEAHPHDHTNPSYQRSWLKSYVAANSAPADLVATTAKSDQTDFQTRAGKFLTVYRNFFFYLLPAIVAYWIPVTGRLKIFLINLLTGWTVVGWIVAAVFVFRGDSEKSPAKRKPKSKPASATAR